MIFFIIRLVMLKINFSYVQFMNRYNNIMVNGRDNVWVLVE